MKALLERFMDWLQSITVSYYYDDEIDDEEHPFL